MTEDNVQKRPQSSCNVSQKFNFTVGALSLLAAAALFLLFVK